MKQLDNEQDIWVSKNKRVFLTTHRLREIHKTVYGSSIKSIMLEHITSSQLRANKQYQFLSLAILYFVIFNGTVYLLNQFLFKAELIKFFFNEVHIGQETALIVFYISLVLALFFIARFFFSVKKVFSFYANGTVIEFQLRWLDFEERESFISKIEDAKDKRIKNLYQQHNKLEK